MPSKCKDIRTREIGRNEEYKMKETVLNVDEYISGTGKEYFISYQSKDGNALFGFIRLRIPLIEYSPVFPTLKNKGLIRELHVYDELIPVGEKNKKSSQHKGFGKKLVSAAEWISWKDNKDGVAIISGEGVRGYYSKLEYIDEDTFMVKYFKISYYKIKLYIKIFLVGIIMLMLIYK